MVELSGTFSNFCFLLHLSQFVDRYIFVFLERLDLVEVRGVEIWNPSQLALNRLEFLTIGHERI